MNLLGKYKYDNILDDSFLNSERKNCREER